MAFLEDAAYPPMIRFRLVVAGRGLVYDGSARSEANRRFTLFVIRSRTAGSRSAGESVTMFKNYDIVRKYHPLDRE